MNSAGSPARLDVTVLTAPTSWWRDTVALLRVLMRMTPEDRFDNQPLQGRSGALMAADLRLDNRDDMLARS